MTDMLERIMHDVTEGAPFDPHAAEPPRSLDEAYRLQSALAARLIESGARDRVAGWKIAANSPTLLQRFGLDEPVSAPVFGTHVRQSPAELDAENYTQFAFEPEIAAIMKADLGVQGDMPDMGTVMDSIDRFVPAFELLDMRRIDMPSIRIEDVVAQNISNVGIVIGGPGIAPRDLDIAQVRTIVNVDGKAELDVTGAAPQHPGEAVAWMAQHLARRGERLRAGQFVLCGTHCPIWFIDGAAEVTAEMSGLGTAAFKLSVP